MWGGGGTGELVSGALPCAVVVFACSVRGFALGCNGVFIRSLMRRMCADRSGSSDDDREDVKKHAKDSETREQKMARRLAKK